MATNDYKPQHSYQDDFGGGPDPIMNELNDDPTDILGVSPEELAKELNKLDDGDDNRERMEDLDEDPEQESLAA